MKKRIFAVVCACLMLFGVAQVNAGARASYDDVEQFTEPIYVAPFWDNIWSISLGLSRSGGNVNWSGDVVGFPGTTRITATFTLERVDDFGRFAFVNSWSHSTNSAVLMASGSTPGAVGTYRLTITTTVTRHGINETVTLSHMRAV